MRPVGSVASLHAAKQSFVMENCVCGYQHTWIPSHGEVVVGQWRSEGVFLVFWKTPLKMSLKNLLKIIYVAI